MVDPKVQFDCPYWVGAHPLVQYGRLPKPYNCTYFKLSLPIAQDGVSDRCRRCPVRQDFERDEMGVFDFSTEARCQLGLNEQPGDIWHRYDLGETMVVPTNGVVKADGRAVMGKGLARQVAEYFPGIDKDLGQMIRVGGNHVYVLRKVGAKGAVVSLPVKEDWRDKADLNLLGRSCRHLDWLVRFGMEVGIGPGKIVLPRVGCGAGGRSWAEVDPILRWYLGGDLRDRYVIVNK